MSSLFSSRRLPVCCHPFYTSHPPPPIILPSSVSLPLPRSTTSHFHSPFLLSLLFFCPLWPFLFLCPFLFHCPLFVSLPPSPHTNPPLVCSRTYFPSSVILTHVLEYCNFRFLHPGSSS